MYNELENCISGMMMPKDFYKYHSRLFDMMLKINTKEFPNTTEYYETKTHIVLKVKKP